ncbi:MAG TPA: hypothetical protein VEL11_07910 [Candidatus Bathyarchaeia archaeon]|nr:hypothetical protein [Candidatus Bathyarchaeia archaeon]
MLQGVRNNTPSYTKEEQEEINKIASRIDKDEIVEIIVKQSKFKPGGSVVTPDTLFGFGLLFLGISHVVYGIGSYFDH